MLLDALRERYVADGYLVLPDLLDAASVDALVAAFDRLVADGVLTVGDRDFVDFTDVVFLDDAFAAVLRLPEVIALLQALLGSDLELQHAKFINKPYRDSGRGAIDWHQDFAFFPHTNFDLLAFAVHLDAEDEDMGPVHVIPGSHKLGPLPHCEGGKFVHRMTRRSEMDGRESVAMTGPRGFVTAHHCLTLHGSPAKRREGQRRILYFQVRTQDNAQLAGYVRKATGYRITPAPADQPRYARLTDGTRIELRGADSKILDPYATLAAAGEGYLTKSV